MDAEMKTDNEVIAEFMGVKIGVDRYSWHPGSSDPIQVENLAYDTQWGWLMPVLEKIDSLGHDTDIMHLIESHDGVKTAKHICAIQKIPAFESVCYVADATKMQAVYKAVVKFIEWYKSNRE